jgi:Skp family chaperone for outer membrane proteins
MEMMIWNIVLTSLVGIMIWVLKEKFSELDRLGILLNRTREEIAREHITRKEVRDDMEKIIQRFDDGFQRLESKIDKLVDERSIPR